jgi:toxin ParE1/3/4
MYIAEDSPRRADAMVERLLSAAHLLSQFPRAGRTGEIGAARELVVARSPYIIVYRIDAGVVVIANVLHGAQRRPE